MKLHLKSSHLYILSFSHKKLALNLIGKLYLNASEQTSYPSTLNQIKSFFSASEIMHISTCNRCEFYIVSKNLLNKEKIYKFIEVFYSSLTIEEKNKLKEKVIFKKDESAVTYLMEVASSLQSLVVGEREIITQVRHAYETCQSLNLTGDLLRLVIKKVIETGKEVFANTAISKNPVSVASLAARQLKNLNIDEHAKVTLIGSGITMQTFMKYFHQEKFQYTFISRNKENSHALQIKYGGNFMNIAELKNQESLHTDVLIVCTASPTPVVNEEIFKKLFFAKQKAIVVDLSNPSDMDEEIFQKYPFEYIGIASLKKQAKENLQKRKQSVIDAQKIIQYNLQDFMLIFKERCVENIIREIPENFKEYKHKALNEVFKKKLQNLNTEEIKVIQEIVDYIEEKYNAVTYKKLKSILLQ